MGAELPNTPTPPKLPARAELPNTPTPPKLPARAELPNAPVSLKPLTSAERTPIHWLSVLQLAACLLAMAFLFLGALAMVLVGGMAAVNGLGGGELISNFITAASLFGVGLLLLPSVYYSLLRVLEKPAVDFRPRLKRIPPAAWLAAFPLVLGAGVLGGQIAALAPIVLPVLHIFAIGLPIAWIVALALRGLPVGSSQRAWGVFNSGLTLGPALIFMLEGLALVGLGLVAAVFLIARPELLDELRELVETLRFSAATQEELLVELRPYLQRPGVILGALAFVALIIPLIEEALKPIGVLLLLGKRLNLRTGFTAGVLSGAGFALIESLLLSGGSVGGASPGLAWATLVLVRTGTGAIHILTTSLTGSAIGAARKRGGILRIGLAYLAAVLIHGLWNGLTVVTVFAGLAGAQEPPGAMSLLERLAIATPFVLVLLAAGALYLLVFFNRRLRRPVPEASAA